MAANDAIGVQREVLDRLRQEISKVLVGQERLVDGMFLALMGGGHILLEGVPGLAKTLTITTLAKAINAKFSRIQFTPDLLPADLIGTLINQKMIYNLNSFETSPVLKHAEHATS